MRWLIQVDKEYLKFSAAHFTLFPDGGRERLHGHNYSLGLEMAADSLDNGFVVDFGPVKTVAREICLRLDEKVLLPTSERIRLQNANLNIEILVDETDFYSFPEMDVIQLPAENVSGECL